MERTLIIGSSLIIMILVYKTVSLRYVGVWELGQKVTFQKKHFYSTFVSMNFKT